MKKLILCLTAVFLLGNPLLGKEQKKDKAIYQVATFGGGCFWSLEDKFEEMKGVIDVVSGYSGGSGKNPVYEDYKKKGHTEVVRITYDPAKIAYQKLLDAFWEKIGIQCLRKNQGTAYKTVIFYHNEEQKKAAEESKTALSKTKIYEKPVMTAILPAAKFYKAEEYHQNYKKKMRNR